MTQIDTILIVKHGALGDVVRTSYILPGLLEKYGSPKVYWLTARSSVDLLRFNPYVFEIVAEGFNSDRLQGVHFDLVISLDDELPVVRQLAQVSHGTLVGAYLDGERVCYTDDSSEWFDMGLISRHGKSRADQLKKENKREHNEIFASMLGVEIKAPIFFNSPLTEARIARCFNREYFNIGLNSGAGSRWFSKQLPIKETVALVEKLLALRIDGKEVCIHLLGGSEEKERHAALLEALRSVRLVDAGNDNTMLEFAAVIRSCDYVISSDSLALHLAISQGKRNLSFYAPTSAAEIGTFGFGRKVLSTADDYCSYRQDADNSSITADRLIEEMARQLQCTLPQ